LAQLSYSNKALADLERLAEFLMQAAPASASATVGLITQAVSVLGHHPYIGRAVGDGLYELVISRGHTGHAALYAVQRMDDAVLILSIRHQREAGYASQEIE
jgi:plasmid stabilization system protein ParE